ncbi:MAG: LpqB family beta-propeller domain-containing protein [Nocardioidaceae bacterium]
MTRRARTVAATVFAAMSVGMSTGCVTIPSSSSVHEGREVGVGGDPQQVANVVAGPVPGADKSTVVAGFYAAMLAYPQDVPTAREFLAPQAAVDWDPGAGRVVYQDLETTQADGPGYVDVHADVLGRLDARGAWTSAETSDSIRDDRVRLVRAEGEWRIANPAPGTFIDSDFFVRNYDPFSVYFFDPSRTVLTPDPVHVALGDATATTLVKDLLLGPTGGLGAVATNSVPEGTGLDVAVSTSSSGLAEVPLTADALQLSPDDLRFFAAQLAWTLRQITGIDDVTITVEGKRLSVPGYGTDFSVDAFSGYDPAGFSGERSLFALGAGGLVTVSEDGVQPVTGPLGQVKDARAAAVDPSGSLGALVSQDGHSVVVGGIPNDSEDGPKVWFDKAADLLRPSFDVHRVLWLVDRTTRGARIYTVTDGHVREVEVRGLTGQQVVSFAVSRDGVRFVASVDRGNESALLVALIDRDPRNHAKVALRTPRQVVSPATSLVDLGSLAWISPTSVVVLAKEPDGEREPWSVAIDGSETDPANGYLPATPTRIAAGPNTEAPIAVAARGGLIYVQTPNLEWLPLGGDSRLRAPVYPG